MPGSYAGAKGRGPLAHARQAHNALRNAAQTRQPGASHTKF